MTRLRLLFNALALLAPVLPAVASETQCNGAGLPEPVLFVLQYPATQDFASVGSLFANHRPTIGSTGRGGDLMICYPDGSLRNLTREAGFGQVGMQTGAAISVRDPHVHWSGHKAVFSMVIGAPTAQYQQRVDYWQMYEVSGLGQGQSVSITPVAHQPTDYNNVDPAYLADDTLVFSSDRPRNGQRHLYPQLDEYESAPTPTGLWKLDPASGAMFLLQHSPSGSFDPFVDSFGRLVFTRWDHLLRDQQGDGVQNPHGAFNYDSEAANATALADRSEVFPETRLVSGIWTGNRINHFMPWMIRPDGTGEETLNHIGRQEMHGYIERAFTGDPALADFVSVNSGRPNPNDVLHMFQVIEDVTTPGRYLAIDGPEFGAFASGQLLSFSAPPGMPARNLVVDYLSDRSGAGFPEPPGANFARYRNPTVLSDGTIVAAHTTTANGATNLGTPTAPQPSYQFRVRRLSAGGNGQFTPGTALTQGIVRTISFYNPDQLVSYTGPLWELSPAPVKARTRPPTVLDPGLEAPEQAAFAAAGGGLESLQAFMKAWNLGLLVVRDATTRDALDKLQPFNLRVPGGTQTSVGPGQLYDVAHFQVVQGDQVRGYGGTGTPSPGRRVLARWLNDLAAIRFNPPNPTGPAGSVGIAADGSIAMFVPARRALSWQVTSPSGDPVVRERYWLNVQPGEIRACDGCHGATPTNQVGGSPATNTPLALQELLTWFGDTHDRMFSGGFQP